MNNPVKIFLSSLCCVFLSACLTIPATAETDTPVTKPNNVIFMLGDGMGHAYVKAYRMYADDLATDIVEPLPFDAYLVGSVSTDAIRMECDALKTSCKRDPHGITDSAASATAYATGHDTIIGRLSVDTAGEPLPTILEDARRAGKRRDRERRAHRGNVGRTQHDVTEPGVRSRRQRCQRGAPARPRRP